MSCIEQSSDRGGRSEKVLIGWLKQMGWAASVAKENEKERHCTGRVASPLDTGCP